MGGTFVPAHPTLHGIGGRVGRGSNFLCLFFGPHQLSLGQAWVEGTGMLALRRHARFAAGKRTVHTPHHHLTRSQTSHE